MISFVIKNNFDQWDENQFGANSDDIMVLISEMVLFSRKLHGGGPSVDLDQIEHFIDGYLCDTGNVRGKIFTYCNWYNACCESLALREVYKNSACK